MPTLHTVSGTYHVDKDSNMDRVTFLPEMVSIHTEITTNVPKGKKYWVVVNSDIKNYSEMKMSMNTINKTSLRNFAETLAESLKAVADNLQEVESILNGTKADEPAVEDYVDEPSTETETDEVVENEEEISSSDDGSEEVVESTETEAEPVTSNESFSERYSKVKNFLNGNM